MNAEIQKLIEHPELIREALKTDQLDRLIHSVTAIWGQSITMKYYVSPGRSEARFEAESEQDLVASSGIFSKVLSECRIDTFNSTLTHDPETGFKVWFTLHLSYQHFQGGSNGMSIATFWFQNGEWTVRGYKGEKEER